MADIIFTPKNREGKKKCKCGNEFEPITHHNSTIKSSKCIECLVKSGRKIKEKQLKETIKKYEENTTDYSQILQDTVNKIVRAIDRGLPCLARGHMANQFHAGHIYARGGNSSMKYNLHNIHRQGAQSNHFQNDDGLLREGLVKEYGQGYMTFISELRRTEPMKFSNIEYKEINKVAKGVLKMFLQKGLTYSKSERINLRNEINLTLGIYKIEYCEFKIN